MIYIFFNIQNVKNYSWLFCARLRLRSEMSDKELMSLKIKGCILVWQPFSKSLTSLGISCWSQISAYVRFLPLHKTSLSEPSSGNSTVCRSLSSELTLFDVLGRGWSLCDAANFFNHGFSLTHSKLVLVADAFLFFLISSWDSLRIVFSLRSTFCMSPGEVAGLFVESAGLVIWLCVELIVCSKPGFRGVSIVRDSSDVLKGKFNPALRGLMIGLPGNYNKTIN